MILTVTLNASIDRRYVVDGFAAGAVNRVRECTHVPGGKGLNVAKPLAIAGCETVATGIVGGHAGRYIEAALSPFGIRSDFFRVEQESRCCINIWDTQSGQQTEFLEPGFTLSEAECEAFFAHFAALLPQAQVVTASGSVPRGMDGSIYRRMVELCRAAGKPMLLDTSGKLLEEGLQACPTLIKPNLDEIRMLTGKRCDDTAELLEAARLLHARGIALVAVSLGAEGSLLVSDEGCYRAVVPKIDAVNTVGCGDAMVAGFAMGLAQELPAAELLRLASAVSAAAAMHPTTGLFRPEDMQALLPQVRVEQLD